MDGFSRKFLFIAGLIIFVGIFPSEIPSQDSVAISVKERAGAARTMEYVSFGVPVPCSWNFLDVSKLRLRDGGGAPVPAQFEVLARWGSHPGDVFVSFSALTFGYDYTDGAGHYLVEDVLIRDIFCFGSCELGKAGYESIIESNIPCLTLTGIPLIPHPLFLRSIKKA